MHGNLAGRSDRMRALQELGPIIIAGWVILAVVSYWVYLA